MSEKECMLEAIKFIKAHGFEAESNHREQMKEIYNNPEYMALQRAYSKIQIENARKSVYGGTPSILEETRALANLENFLKEHGATLEPKYFCKRCKDTGIFGEHYCECVKRFADKLSELYDKKAN